MESPESSPSPMTFCDFPEDVQLAVLSFLRPAEIAAFACTSRRFASLCAQDRLWFAMCDRRWGSKTRIRSWIRGGSRSIPFALLYRSLNRWEKLIGFWRRIAREWGASSLVFFEWGPCFITGSFVAESPEAGSYGVLKVPFLWIGLSPRGSCCVSSTVLTDVDFLPSTIGFIGENHFVVENNTDVRGGADSWSSDDLSNSEESAYVEEFLSDIYQCLGNRTTSFGNKVIGKVENSVRNHWVTEHFVKITNCYPTPERPLQGLWKVLGIGESMRLAFYIVTYDSMGTISCRRVGDVSEPLSGYLPIFWTSNTSFLEYPFSRKEDDIFCSREHIGPPSLHSIGMKKVVSGIFYTNSSYDLVSVDSSGSTVDYQNVEGRIWLYNTGTFGFGFLRNNYIVDLTRIALNGCLLDTVEPSSESC
ncbi:unnamed protein product [Spirodela intermedia]|uniref:F-box protein n=1 Tax=Spirodela intermedia TaxID=51605 RepID=A0A7I8III3_SPIIN|nr:unnamed protein product [Spirodela intermedia]CAA6657536.1 unnamed protein product [Spirodela intermedia]